MKKIILFSCLFLSACAANDFPFCEQYVYLNKNTDSKATLYIQKNGRMEKEIKTPQKQFSKKGLYTLQHNELTTYIKNKKETYFIQDKELLIEESTKNIYQCQ